MSTVPQPIVIDDAAKKQLGSGSSDERVTEKEVQYDGETETLHSSDVAFELLVKEEEGHDIKLRTMG